MERSALKRAAGFVTALGASAALVGAAVHTTGAYFTDSHDGTINTSTGTVHVNTTDTTLNFDNLLPGAYQSDTVSYQATGTGKQDLWFVLPAGAAANTLTGVDPGTALGRYGHFKLTSNAGSFVSNNLRSGDPSQSCPVDGDGHGGSNALATSTSDYIPYCGVPNAILLQQNMNPGDTGSFSVEFGYTQLLKDPAAQGLPRSVLAQYKIVATQAGVRPDDPNN